MVTHFDGWYRWVLDDDWQWLKAIAIHESQEDPNTPDGDGGLAVGILQEHPDFFSDFGAPHCGPQCRREVICSLIAFRNFWFKYSMLALRDRVGIFNHGANGWSLIQDRLHDEYVCKVEVIHARLVGRLAA